MWTRANGRCEACGKKVDFPGMQVGHKTAHSKGGGTTIRNSACLCYTCNKLQGTDSWAKFIRKMGPAAKGAAKAASEKPKKAKKKVARKKKDFMDQLADAFTIRF